MKSSSLFRVASCLLEEFKNKPCNLLNDNTGKKEINSSEIALNSSCVLQLIGSKKPVMLAKILLNKIFYDLNTNLRYHRVNLATCAKLQLIDVRPLIFQTVTTLT